MDALGAEKTSRNSVILACFHTNTSLIGFPDMVQKGESSDPYDPPLDPLLTYGYVRLGIISQI